MKPISCLCPLFALLWLAACTTTPYFPSPGPRPAPPPTGGTTISPGTSAISPALRERAARACEAVAAGSVRGRYPQPGNAMFTPDRERTWLNPAGLVALSGEGAFEPDSSEASLPFRYTCTYNPRTGKVEDVQMRY